MAITGPKPVRGETTFFSNFFRYIVETDYKKVRGAFDVSFVCFKLRVCIRFLTDSEIAGRLDHCCSDRTNGFSCSLDESARVAAE